jgi:hypothetical protein
LRGDACIAVLPADAEGFPVSRAVAIRSLTAELGEVALLWRHAPHKEVSSGNLGADCVSEQHRVSLCLARGLYEPAAATVERLTDDDVRTVAGDDPATGAAASSDGSLPGWAADRYGVEVLVRHVAPPVGCVNSVTTRICRGIMSGVKPGCAHPSSGAVAPHASRQATRTPNHAPDSPRTPSAQARRRRRPPRPGLTRDHVDPRLGVSRFPGLHEPRQNRAVAPIADAVQKLSLDRITARG